jgi:DNA-binding MarR family transcriptional regulator
MDNDRAAVTRAERDGRAGRRELAHSAIFELTRLSDAFSVRRRQLAENSGLTETQWETLEEIATEHFMPSMFASERNSSRAFVSKTIRQLVDQGLVEVSLAEHDARHRDYQLTPTGRATMDALRKDRERAISAIWMKIDERRLRQFAKFSSELADALEKYVQVEGRGQ